MLKEKSKTEIDMFEEFLHNPEFLSQFGKFVEAKRETSSSSSLEAEPIQDAQDPYEGYDFDMDL